MSTYVKLRKTNNELKMPSGSNLCTFSYDMVLKQKTTDDDYTKSRMAYIDGSFQRDNDGIVLKNLVVFPFYIDCRRKGSTFFTPSEQLPSHACYSKLDATCKTKQDITNIITTSSVIKQMIHANDEELRFMAVNKLKPLRLNCNLNQFESGYITMMYNYIIELLPEKIYKKAVKLGWMDKDSDKYQQLTFDDIMDKVPVLKCKGAEDVIILYKNQQIFIDTITNMAL